MLNANIMFYVYGIYIVLVFFINVFLIHVFYYVNEFKFPF